ncbi:hypothetical protein [Streptomyces sp. NPDC098781]|uniref:hypothetical protein n=1 Tax=Streptomyces sp. NPDC098781 TaxID=3366097 RepID=UPI00382D4B33
MNEVADEAGWDVEPGDEIEPVVQAVGRLLKVCREAAGMRVGSVHENRQQMFTTSGGTWVRPGIELRGPPSAL